MDGFFHMISSDGTPYALCTTADPLSTPAKSLHSGRLINQCSYPLKGTSRSLEIRRISDNTRADAWQFFTGKHLYEAEQPA